MVAVAGRYRTGKSFLLNHVLLQQPPGGGFQVGPTTQPCTKGLWLWTDPVREGGGPCTLVIDTEGTGATNSNDNRDTRIFALALLLSSYFIYNSQGSIDEPAISSLQVVTNVSKMVRVSAEDVSPFAGAFGEAPAECKEVGDFFPHFLWVVRDFILEMRGADGSALQEHEYLEEALQDHAAGGEGNKMRTALKRCFPHRDCCTLVRPVSDETQLRQLDSMDASEMRPQFVEQAAQLRRKVLGGAPPKMVGGQPVTGPLLAGLCRCYVDSINSGAAPVIENAWSMCVRRPVPPGRPGRPFRMGPGGRCGGPAGAPRPGAPHARRRHAAGGAAVPGSGPRATMRPRSCSSCSARWTTAAARSSRSGAGSGGSCMRSMRSGCWRSCPSTASRWTRYSPRSSRPCRPRPTRW